MQPSASNTRLPPLNTWSGAAGFYLLIALLVHVPGLGSTGLVGLEAMAATTAERMLESGEFVVPELYGEIYTYKPPLLYWLISQSVRLFGPHEWAVRLPGASLSALAGLIVLGLIGHASRPRVGLGAALATITGFLWMQKSRQGDFDVVISSLVGIAVAAACHNLAVGRRRSSPWIWFLAYMALAGGFLAKGVPAVMAFAPGFLVAAVVSGQTRQLTSRGHLLSAAAGLAIVGGYSSILWRAAGASALEQPLTEARVRGFEWSVSTLGRTLLKPLNIFGAFLPWSLAWPWSLPSPWRLERTATSTERLARVAWAFLGMGVLAFMAVPTAETRYYMPLAVPAAIVSAIGLEHLAEPSRRASLLLRGAVVFFAAATILLTIGSFPDSTRVLLAGIGMTVFAAQAVQRRVVPRYRAAFLLLVAALCGWAVEVGALRPHRGQTRVLDAVARQLDADLPPGATVWAPGDADHAGRNGSLFHYLRRPVRTFRLAKALPPGGSYVLLTAPELARLERAAPGHSATLGVIREIRDPFSDFFLCRIDEARSDNASRQAPASAASPSGASGRSGRMRR